MKKVIFLSMLMIFALSLPVCASETTKIPEMSMEEYANMINSKQAKVDIIKKNNREVTALKEELRAKILEAANKVNNLKINVSNNSVDIPDETIRELKNLLEFLQEAKTTLESDVQKISDEIEKICEQNGIDSKKNMVVLKHISYQALGAKINFLKSSNLPIINQDGLLDSIFSMSSGTMQEKYGISLEELLKEYDLDRKKERF